MKGTSYVGSRTLYETIQEYSNALSTSDNETALSLLDVIFASSTMEQRLKKLSFKIISVYGELKLFGNILSNLSRSDIKQELTLRLKQKLLKMNPQLLQVKCETHARYVSRFWAVVALKEKEITSDFLLVYAQKLYPSLSCNYLRVCLSFYNHGLDVVEIPLEILLAQIEKQPIKANGKQVSARTIKNIKILLGQEKKELLFPPKHSVRKAKYHDEQGNPFFSQKEMCEFHDVPLSWYKNKIKHGYSPSDAIKSYRSTSGCGANRKLNIEPRDHLGNEYPTISKMCETYKVPVSTFYYRMHRKYSLKDSLTKK